jgi:hypothetical protein
MTDREIYLTKNVFVAGSAPGITYNPRTERHLERGLNQYLDQGPGRALTVSGPSKSGKTVLVERLLPRDQNIWIEGPDLTTVDLMWDRIVDWLGLYDLVEVSRQQADGEGRQLGMSVGVPKVVSFDASKKNDNTITTGVRRSRKQAITTVAREGLEAVETPVVIDDFHYIAEEAKQAVARAIKTIIPFSKVVLIAIPHEAFDVVRNEADMGGRVSQLLIDVWSEEELQFIAESGFAALNIADEHEIGVTLAANSYGAPFLMQDLCYQYSYSIDVLKTADEPVAAQPPESWPHFFREIADRTPSAIFADLLKGPKERGQKRQVRTFRDGGTSDIYGALLYAVARAGKTCVPYRELTQILERNLTEPPGGQTITLSLGQMSTIAEDHRGTGDPALAYKNDVLHVLDPFLLFYLRYGTYSLMKDVSRHDPEQAELETAVDPGLGGDTPESWIPPAA